MLCQDLTPKLVTPKLAPCVVLTSSANPIYGWFICREQTEFDIVHSAMLYSVCDALRTIAYIWFANRMFHSPTISHELSKVCAREELAKRAAACMAAACLFDINEGGAALKWLLAHAADDNESVREQVFQLDWDIIVSEGGQRLHSLILALEKTPKFPSSAERLVAILGDSAATPPELAFIVVKKVLASHSISESNQQPTIPYGLSKLVMAVSESAASRDHEYSEALDLVDQFLALELDSNTAIELERYDRQ